MILIPTHQPIGLSTYRSLDLGVTGQVIKSGAGQLYGWYIANNADAARFVKLYDKATAPTGADTPIATIQVPAASAANAFSDLGISFHHGISARASTAIADNDTGAPSANDVVINLFYV